MVQISRREQIILMVKNQAEQQAQHARIAVQVKWKLLKKQEVAEDK